MACFSVSPSCGKLTHLRSQSAMGKRYPIPCRILDRAAPTALLSLEYVARPRSLVPLRKAERGHQLKPFCLHFLVNARAMSLHPTVGLPCCSYQWDRLTPRRRHDSNSVPDFLGLHVRVLVCSVPWPSVSRCCRRRRSVLVGFLQHLLPRAGQQPQPHAFRELLGLRGGDDAAHRLGPPQPRCDFPRAANRFQALATRLTRSPVCGTTLPGSLDLLLSCGAIQTEEMYRSMYLNPNSPWKPFILTPLLLPVRTLPSPRDGAHHVWAEKRACPKRFLLPGFFFF